MTNWEIKGDSIVEDSGLPFRTGAEIEHHGHANHPIVRAAMHRGDVRAVVAAVIAAHRGRDCWVGGWYVDAKGVVRGLVSMAGSRYTSDALRASPRIPDARGLTIDKVIADTCTIQHGMSRRLPICEVTHDGYVGTEIAADFAEPAAHMA